ncbi:MAG: SprT-like domain-containing protein [Oscillospiraceae bacterium]|nr:SprT-like domain-containing protein [Oscillospiraceae bacterium]
MKQTVKTSRTAGYLEKIFRALNAHYFDGAIEEAIITIQSTPRAYGHVTVAKAWSKADGETRHELNIGAGTLDRPIEEVVATMQHEMVHLYCLQNGIKDTSRGGAYHNKRFKAEAEKRDLTISYDSKIGWSITQPTDALMEFILEQGWSEIMMSRSDGFSIRGTGGTMGGGGVPFTPKGSNSRKYQCPCCRNSVRATKAVNLICADCMERMILCG